MSRPVIVSVDIHAPRPDVWDEVSELARHVEWMADAHSIEFPGPERSGVGTTMHVQTRFGPLRTNDVMVVTGWDPGERIAVEHRGLFTGTGAFTLADHGSGTRFTWTEEIRFPWWLGGPIGTWLARPIFHLVWRRNLRRLRDRLSSR